MTRRLLYLTVVVLVTLGFVADAAWSAPRGAGISPALPRLTGAVPAGRPLVLVETAQAPVCAQAPSRCADGLRGIWDAQVGDGCCSRHLAVCESLCSCGITSFSCWDNGRGGCSSQCNCKKCV